MEDERITPDGDPAAWDGGAVSKLVALRIERGLLQAVDRVARQGRMSRSEAMRYLIQRGMRTLSEPEDGRAFNRRRRQ